MQGISDIKIIGIDETRPPQIRKEPYINLYFKLIHKAPQDWCNDFNNLVAKGSFPVKIAPESGMIIETWVRKPEEIPLALDKLKKSVIACNEQYIARIAALARANAAKMGVGKSDDEGEQGRLNRIVAALDFSD